MINHWYRTELFCEMNRKQFGTQVNNIVDVCCCGYSCVGLKVLLTLLEELRMEGKFRSFIKWV